MSDLPYGVSDPGDDPLRRRRIRRLLRDMHELKYCRDGRKYGGGGYLPNQDEQISWVRE